MVISRWLNRELNRTNQPDVQPEGEQISFSQNPRVMNLTSSQDVSVAGAVELTLKYWYLMVTCVVVSVLGAMLYVFTVTPIYRAELTMAPVKQQESSAIMAQLGGLASLAGFNIGQAASSRNAMAILTSRAFLRTFISAHQLEDQLLPDWNEAAANAQGERKLNKAVDYFQEEILLVQPDAKTGLINLYVDWSDADTAAKWANSLASDVNAYIRLKDQAQAEKNVEYLQDQFGRTNLLVMQDAISRLLETEMNTLMLAQGREEYAFEIIDPAVVPLGRHSPRTVLVSILAVLLGLLLGLASASIVDARKLSTAARATN